MDALAILDRWEALPLDGAIYPHLQVLDEKSRSFALPTTFAPSCSTKAPTSPIYLPDANTDEEEARTSAQTDFLRWYENLAEQMEREQEAPFLQHLASVEQLKEKAASMMQVLTSSLTLLDEIGEEHRFVQDKSADLQSHCDTLLQEQRALTLSSSTYLSHLRPFADIDTLAKQLGVLQENALGQMSIVSQQLVPALDKLDTCLHFLQGHKHYKEAPAYATKAKSVLQHALTLIRNYYANVMRHINADVQRILSDKGTLDLPPSTQSTIFYVKFRNEAPKLRALLAELESRLIKGTSLGHLLDECHQGFLMSRSTLLHPVIAHQVKQLQHEHVKENMSSADLTTFCEKAIALSEKVVHDEEALFQCFFASGKEALQEYLEATASLLYDEMRPLILKQTDLTIIARVIKMLMAYPAVAPVMRDAQSKLLFRAQAFIDTEIRPLALSAKNATPALLGGWNRATAQLPKWRDVSIDNIVAEQFKAWHPALCRVLHVLDVLWGAVDNTVYVDLSKDMIQLCVKALSLEASELAETSKLASGKFLLKHLMVLKLFLDELAVDEQPLYIMVELADFRDSILSLFNGQGGFLSSISAPYDLWRGLSSVHSLVEDPRKATLDINAALDKLCEDISKSMDQGQSLPRDADGKVSVDNILNYLDDLE